MIGIIVTFAMNRGLTETAARRVAIAALIVAVLVLLLIGKAIYDRTLIANHDTATRAATAERSLELEHKADAGELVARDRDEVRADNLQGAIDNAVSIQPQAARAGAGPAVNAALAELRRRQATERGKQADAR
jgi:uncharacterized membrane protein